MASLADHLNKLRDERMAREKARIEKLRELNLKKYNRGEPQPTSNASTSISVDKSVQNVNTKASKTVKNKYDMNKSRPSTILTQFKNKTSSNEIKKPLFNNHTRPNNLTNAYIPKVEVKPKDAFQKPIVKPFEKTTNNQKIDKEKIFKTELSTKKNTFQNAINKPTNKPDIKTSRKSIAVTSFKAPGQVKTQLNTTGQSRKTMLPVPQHLTNQQNKESVFDRLYKPKQAPQKQENKVEKLKNNPDYFRQAIKNSSLIVNKRHTLFEPRQTTDVPVRRSISAVHLKKVNKNELSNCIHRWSSVSENLDKAGLKEVNEDESIKEEKIISAIKSDRKKVTFNTPVPFNFNTPKPEELQARLKSWLLKRGKSLDTFHHLQCFGIHHMARRELKQPSPPKFELYDEENKENIALESDSDNDSFEEMSNRDEGKDKWRKASYVSDSGDYNDTRESIKSSDLHHQEDELVLGALNDLTDLLREGFEWSAGARWLRAVRERFPAAARTPAYWECRAALEERRGDLPASVHCWEEAIAVGTERSVVEANLDQLLDKFMQLKIDSGSGEAKRLDPKMVDVKNVFKSTIIRFAVQQAKLRQSSESEPVKFTVTPVRRSGRLSVYGSGRRGHGTAVSGHGAAVSGHGAAVSGHGAAVSGHGAAVSGHGAAVSGHGAAVSGHGSTLPARAPLRECASVRQALQLGEAVFVPNTNLCDTP